MIDGMTDNRKRLLHSWRTGDVNVIYVKMMSDYNRKDQ